MSHWGPPVNTPGNIHGNLATVIGPQPAQVVLPPEPVRPGIILQNGKRRREQSDPGHAEIYTSCHASHPGELPLQKLLLDSYQNLRGNQFVATKLLLLHGLAGAVLLHELLSFFLHVW